jgi:hypothetical protein
MGYFVTHLYGSSNRYQDTTSLKQNIESLLAELGDADDEHTNVAVGPLESEWVLSIFPDGYVIWGGEDESEAKHMSGLAPEEVAELAGAVAKGDIDWVNARPWSPGYGS